MLLPELPEVLSLPEFAVAPFGKPAPPCDRPASPPPPVSWDKLKQLKSGSQWTIATAREYLSFQQDDPWADYWSSKQTLTEPMKALGYKPLPRR